MANSRFALADIDFGPLTDEELAGIRRHAQREAMGMHEYTCANCGEQFVAYQEHRYRAEKKGKILMFCSHKCFRPTEKKEEERWHRQMLGAWVVGDNRVKTPLERAREDVNRCKAGLKKAEQKAKSQEWGTMTSSQKYKLNQRIASWRARLMLAEEELEALKANEGAGGVRGIASGDDAPLEIPLVA